MQSRPLAGFLNAKPAAGRLFIYRYHAIYKKITDRVFTNIYKLSIARLPVN